MTVEHGRLDEARQQSRPWKKWGPYLSERQWGTVREDYQHCFHGRDLGEERAQPRIQRNQGCDSGPASSASTSPSAS
jgi:hypothetical protein